MAKRALLLFSAACLTLLMPGRADAHPLDQLGQLVIVHLGAKTTQVSLTIGGGMLANEMVLQDLDANGDGVISPAEQSAWLERLAREVHISLDGAQVPIAPNQIAVSLPNVKDFHYGLAPIVATFPVPLPNQAGARAHLITFRSNYQPDLARYGLQVQSAPGASVTDQSWPAREMKVAFTTDPAAATMAAASASRSTSAAASAWSANRIVKRASDLLNHRHTPAFLVLMAAVFIGLGALHALQPGHGKTLVAAYLVATGGGTRDAMMLALIVTLTHTVSVFALGLATLGASQLFLPSRVIPIMGVISGIIVAVMGVGMIWSSRRRLAAISMNVEHGHHHNHNHDHQHGHDHAHLSDEEHARLHLEEALKARSGVSRKAIVTMGVSGGLAPCPDALAILLIAIGMGQGVLGMFAIVAFSIGLAGVLVLFGLAIVLAAPLWTRVRETAGQRGFLSVSLVRLARFAPVVSGAVILVFGVAMAWSSVIRG